MSDWHPVTREEARVPCPYCHARAKQPCQVFLDPLVENLHTTLIARNRYRGGIATAPRSVTSTTFAAGVANRAPSHAQVAERHSERL
jgi:hypothetical protein